MIALYIILGLVLLFALIFSSSISLKVRFDDSFNASVNYLFFRFEIPEDFKNKKKTKAQKDDKTNKKSYLKRLIDEKGLLEAIKEIFGVLKAALSKLGKLTKHIRAKKIFLNITVANSDPAIVGIEYGSVYALISPIVSWLRNSIQLNDKKTKISINSDFCGGKPSLKFDIVFKVRVWFIFTAFISLVIDLVKSKIKKINSNETSIKIKEC